jgi:hypothetical protein
MKREDRSMDIDAFFKEDGIDEYAIVRLEDLPDADRPASCTSFSPLVLLLSSALRSRFLSMKFP